MTDEETDGGVEIDEIDRQILELLADDPRKPYADIANELADYDIDMSSEGVRRRVTSLLENMTSFFLPRPDQNNWDVILVTARVIDEPDAKQTVFESMAEMNFWFVANGFGTFDIYGIATTRTNQEIDELITEVRSLESVMEMDYFIETARAVNIQKYLPVY